MSDLRLEHYSQRPVDMVGSRTQSAEPTDKPTGLWVSVVGDDDWFHWCKSEMPEWAVGRLVYNVSIRPDAEILHLQSAFDVLDFHQEFSRQRKHERQYGLGGVVDWASVSKRWSGIIIAPYQWSLRLDGPARWYYAWDCASGCIWDADAVASILPALE